MGPMVWELDGPIPILNNSKILVMDWRMDEILVSAEGIEPSTY